MPDFPTLPEGHGVPLVDLATGLLTGATMDALDLRYPDELDVTELEILTQVGRLSPEGVAADIKERVDLPPAVLASGAQLSSLPGRMYNKYRQNAGAMSNIATSGEAQYVVWMDDSSNPIIAQRTLPSGRWSTFDLSDVAGNPLRAPTEDDGHNHYVVAVDADGYVHVAGNMHGDWMSAVRSLAPHDITAWEREAMVNGYPPTVSTPERSVSYPQYVLMPDDEFLFFFREGSAGGGIVHINLYDHATKTWTRRSTIIDGIPGAVAAGPYVTKVIPTDDGVIHLFFDWRPDGSSVNTNVIGYMRSSDGGVSWVNSAGAALTLPVTQATTPSIATPATPQNLTSFAVDSSGNPHTAYWAIESTQSVLKHLYWNGSAWVADTVLSPNPHTTNVQIMASTPLIPVGDRMWLAYSISDRQYNSDIRLRDVTPGGTAEDVPLITTDLGSYELTYDWQALRDRRELVALVTPTSPEELVGALPDRYARAWGAVLTLPVDTLGSAQRTTRRVERVFVNAMELSDWEGTPTRKALAGSPTWLMADAATRSVVALVWIPPEWQAVNVDLWWCNDSTGAGNVVFEAQAGAIRYGKQLTLTADFQKTQAYTAAASTSQNTPVIHRVLTAYPIVYRGEDRLIRIGVRRYGADAADTLANSICVIGLMLSPATL